jgi:hypothetical protein
MTVETTVAAPPKGRLVAGAAVFVLGWIVTLVIVPLITASSLPTSIVPIVVFILPKVGVLAAVAILGKAGFAYLKQLVFGRLRPASDVGPVRHRVGMVMFVAALLFSFLEPYGFFRSDAAARSLRVTLAVDLLLLASTFVLGGNFWDKIRALFVREAKVVFPARA